MYVWGGGGGGVAYIAVCHEGRYMYFENSREQ